MPEFAGDESPAPFYRLAPMRKLRHALLKESVSSSVFLTFCFQLFAFGFMAVLSVNSGVRRNDGFPKKRFAPSPMLSAFRFMFFRRSWSGTPT